MYGLLTGNEINEVEQDGSKSKNLPIDSPTEQRFTPQTTSSKVKEIR
jgi:hypothetical protein